MNESTDQCEAEIDQSVFGENGFIHSELFAKTFKEGMALVEDTADYLDGDGRGASRDLPKNAALAYAGASMRLTTQLMQIASWLLVLRAVREGDMSANEAWDKKYRLPVKEAARPSEYHDLLPFTLVELIDEANQLYDRIGRLDGELFGDVSSDEPVGDAAAQQRALASAFSA